MDLWVYQEIVWDLQPTLIIETGTAYGGSALYFARQLDRVGEGHVLSIDLEPAERLPTHPRISYVRGFSSVHAELVAKVQAIAHGHPRVMVVLDSDHAKRHVLAELEAYAPLVTKNQFLVVEDTNMNGRPVDIDWHGGPGPGLAVDEWLPQHKEFERALLAERYLLTMHPNGWMRRIA
jgi:cephalosporin hydroxylase